MLRHGVTVCRGKLRAIYSSHESPWLAVWFASYSDSPTKKGKLAPLQERRMVDRFRLWAKGGEGGNGCCSFRRSRTDRRGKPDGGNGGRGGDVILECSADVWDFSNLQHHTNAKRGGHGVSKNQAGTRGSDKVVQVPIGTVIHLVSGEIPSFVEIKSIKSLDPWDIPSINDEHSPPKSVQTNKVTANGKYNFAENSDQNKITEQIGEIQNSVAELTIPGQRLVIAGGGEGGPGNSSLPKEQKSQTDESQTWSNSGRSGSESILILELKSIADVGLVGMPNSGKSTLLGALSRARPAVSDYAFTTLRPNIGNLSYSDFFSVKIADIPGLIKGASVNRGLGHAFLRHIERTRVLAYVVDLAAGLNGRKGVPPWEQLRDLVLELEFYQKGLSRKPSLVVANKIDEQGAEQVFDELRFRVRDVRIFPVCAVLGEGVSDLKDGLRRLMDGSDCNNLDLNKINVD